MPYRSLAVCSVNVEALRRKKFKKIKLFCDFGEPQMTKVVSGYKDFEIALKYKIILK